MGKALTQADIDRLIKENPTTQMFDICCVCGKTEGYLEMRDVDDDTFDVICDECQEDIIL